MALEDYFHYITYEERNPITIGWVHDEICEDVYNILIIDRNNISVRDSMKLKKESVNKEIDRLTNILENGRGYVVIKKYID